METLLIDLDPATAFIEHEAVKFTGAPAIAPDGSLFIPNPDPIRYIGEPGPEVDKNWDAITGELIVLVLSK
jgi:hypothetical protein